MPTNFPAILPTSVQFGLRSNTQVFSSPFSSSVQTVRMPGAAWFGTANFDDLEEAEARELIAFLMEMDGMQGRFYFGDLSKMTPRGAATGIARVRGGSQTGNAINVDGLSGSTSNVFLPGDYIAFDTTQGRELHMVTQSANTNSSGQATLSISPSIRTSPANDAIVTIGSSITSGIGNTDLSCVMRLQADQSSWSVRAPIVSSIRVSFVEAFS